MMKTVTYNAGDVISAEEKMRIKKEIEAAEKMEPVFDEDSPRLSPRLLESLRHAAIQRNRRMANKGFSIVELVVVISIMVALGVTTALVVTQYIEKSKEATARYNARSLYDAAQVAVMQASQNTGAAFRYAIKYEETIDGNAVRMGRFTNQSLYKYLTENDTTGALSGAKSKACDYYIAEQLVKTLPNSAGTIEDDLLKSVSPITDGHSVKYMADNASTYGNVVFAMAYSGGGDIIYFQCIYDGYFYELKDGEFVGKKVDDSTYFNNWPNTRFQQSKDEKW